MNNRTLIIAEAGVNHNGSVKTAKKLVDAALRSGADAVKFQTFRAQDLVGKLASKAPYQNRTTCRNETQLEMLRRLELNADDHRTLIGYCKKKRIQFLSSPFDLFGVEMLDGLGLNIFKIPSGEITNLPYLRKIGGLNKKIIMSTGMADLREINDALSALVKAGTKKENITILHCNTEYPTPSEDVNLLAMLSIKKHFNTDVGYSDHTLGIEVPVAAVALGAKIIEKHLTLDRNMKGPDHKASLEPHEFAMMVRAIRNVEKALGSGVKRISRSELNNIKVVRKSIVATRPIKKGEIFTSENLGVKRPGTGLNPMEWDRVIGGIAKKDFVADEWIVL